jgi:hypothetical protein
VASRLRSSSTLSSILTPRGLAPSFFIYFIINPLFARPEFSPKWGDVEEPLHYRARVSSRLSDASDFALRV